MTTELTIDQLFTPAPSGVGLNPASPPDSGTWLYTLLANATTLGLPTTAWQPGGPERTILADLAVVLANEDGIISTMAQGGFLDFAASGTVTVVAPDGESTTTAVTPDPSNPAENPTGAAGWLDLLAASVYGVTRPQATYAMGALAIANTAGSTYGPYAAGTYHVANAVTGATYANTDTLTLASSVIGGSGGVITAVVVGATTTITTAAAHGLAVGQSVVIQGVNGVTGLNGVFTQVSAATGLTLTIPVVTTGAWVSAGDVFLCTVGQFQADLISLVGNAAPGAVTTTVTQNTGVTCANLTGWSAANYGTNTQLATLCRLSMAAASPNGPSQAYEYFALTAQAKLAAQSPPVALTNGPIVSAISYGDPVSGNVTLIVASATPASIVSFYPVTPGVVRLAVTAVSTGAPSQISTVDPHTLTTGDVVTITGVLGAIEVNGSWTVTVLGPYDFTLDGSNDVNVYAGGGYVNGGDLGAIDTLIQENVVPDGVIANTLSAWAFPLTIVAGVVVPRTLVATYQAAVQRAMSTLIASLPIGGEIPVGGGDGILPVSAIEGVLFSAGTLTPAGVSYVRQVTSLTLNGGTVDLTYPSPRHYGVLVTLSVSVTGI